MAQEHVSFPAPMDTDSTAISMGKASRHSAGAWRTLQQESWTNKHNFSPSMASRIGHRFRGYGQTIAGTETSDEKATPTSWPPFDTCTPLAPGPFPLWREHGRRRGCRRSDRGTPRRDRAYRIPGFRRRHLAERLQGRNSSSSAATIRAPTVLGFQDFRALRPCPGTQELVVLKAQPRAVYFRYRSSPRLIQDYFAFFRTVGHRSMPVLVIGGHTRSVGKTSVVAGLIAALPGYHWTP